MKNQAYAASISSSILKINKEFPAAPIGEHIAHALMGRDIYNVTDRELAEALTTYVDEMASTFISDDSPDSEYDE